MENCKHVAKITPAADHSILNPQKWLCYECGTTESVWACLSCSNVACGRYNEEHALTHFKESKHPLTIEVNEKYVFCYECDEYVLNDNASSDIKILRSALSAIATQQFHGLEIAGKRHLLRSQSFQGVGSSGYDEERLLRYKDLSYTALKFRRYYLLARVFGAWRSYNRTIKEYRKRQLNEVNQVVKEEVVVVKPKLKAVLSDSKKKGPIMPGVVGLRNLGNTCYMNSILQVISHLKELRDFFLNLHNVLESCMANSGVAASTSSASKSTPPRVTRQSTMECFQYLAEGSNNKKKGGLNGGGSAHSSARNSPLTLPSSRSLRSPSHTLCQEIHALLRVMWSGKWALVSPHKLLYAVWTVIPFFKGYSQQDAQEFLCEVLDKVENELHSMLPAIDPGRDNDLIKGPMNNMRDIIDRVFSGQLVSEVTCVACGNKSRTYEPYMDLSLEFPVKYQTHLASAQGKCHINEMLVKFTEKERLDGKIYACEICNKRRRSTNQQPVLTNAEKRIMLNKLPQVLRLHLKRFMWSGRNHRGKISVHVKFDEYLDVRPYCYLPDNQPQGTRYRLSAVVMHHGRGFGSGHYTAYCWNEEAESWVHCNDARMQICSLDDVTRSQAYILFYSKVQEEDEEDLSQPLQTLFEEHADEEIVFNFRNSTIPRFVELKRRLSDPGTVGPVLKRSRSNIW